MIEYTSNGIVAAKGFNMRYYREHRKEYVEYQQAQAVLNGIIEEYMQALQKTQPHSPCLSDTRPSRRINRTEEYIIEVESKNLKRRAEDAERVLHLKRELLDLKEAELRKSKDVYDCLYAGKWIDHKKVSEIIRDLDFKGIYYSTSQVYEILKRIRAEIER